MTVSYTKSINQTSNEHQSGKPDYEVVIIGAGISGMGTAIRLLAEKMDSFIILERASGVGGTWRDNQYPGIAVDISSFTYSFSFEQSPNWSRFFAPGKDLHNYTKRVGAKYGLYPYMRFNTSVSRAEFDSVNHVWKITLDEGEIMTARHIVSATGGLISPKDPDIKGLDTFEGEKLHTGRWDHNIDMKGKRVGVIGTGATAVQMVPELAKEVAHLDVYQRTPIWVLSKPDTDVPAWLKSALRNVPLLLSGLRVVTDLFSEAVMVISFLYYKQAPWIAQSAEKQGVQNMQKQLPNRQDLWDKLEPKYGFGCKRPTFSNEYFETYGRDYVDLITTPIDCIEKDGIRTKDGELHPIDILILATGYRVFEKGNLPSYEVIGTNGQDIGEFWEQERHQSYLGCTVPKYPNFYTILGPYSLLGTSYFKTVECNSLHAVRCIKEAKKRNATCVEVKPEVHQEYFEEIHKRQANTIFMNHNCGTANSYYFDVHGDAPMLRPSTTWEAAWRSRTFSLNNYSYTKAKVMA
ncbi:MAG: NAD(P)/FAD-dependent oxidoreductase [Pseudomonadales bacterium]|nr:NAD(P)/FAD-dependent oxidoreductase [Pseudomonadales bacterium]